MTQTTETTKTIQMLPIEYLSSHPQNPRKDLGDLQELTESIRENGILQNLTVTPWLGEVTGKVLENTYKVIIGHRRLAAAKLAGLTHVPCVVANMTPAEQKKTMALENRCFAQTLGALYNRCEYRSTCQAQLKHMQKITFASPGM